MQIDPSGLQGGVSGVGLLRLQCRARLPQPSQAGVAPLVAAATLKPGATPGAGENFIQSGRRQRRSATWALEHHEHRVGARLGGSRGPQVGGDRGEETADDAGISR